MRSIFGDTRLRCPARDRRPRRRGGSTPTIRRRGSCPTTSLADQRLIDFRPDMRILASVGALLFAGGCR